MSDADPSDEVLIARYVRGDGEAFATLYRRHELRVWRYLERNVGNRATAEELMQEVWFAVARDVEGWRPRARFTTWLFTIARNRMVDALRARRPQVSLDVVGHEDAAVVEQLTADAGAGPLAATEARDQAVALKAALTRLAPEQRDALLLQLEGDLSVEEVAAITGAGFETVKSRLRYARTQLRQLLSEYA
jgi:RNA polymerase sigma-70 factor (ECF subfamily)